MKKITLFILFSLIYLIPYSQCNEPSNVHINDFIDYEVFVTWDTNGENNWDIEYGETGFIPTGIPITENIGVNKFQTYFMTSSLNLDFYVRANCGAETSNWVGPFTFYNYCTETLLNNPVVDELFENNFIPVCFTETNVGSPNANYAVSNTSIWEQANFATNGTLSAKINVQGTEVNDWLILPLITGIFGVRSSSGGGDQSLFLNFNVALTEHNTNAPATLGSDDEIKLVISPDYGVTWYNIRTWNSSSVISNTGEFINIEYLNFTDGFDLFFSPLLVAFWVSSGATNDSQDVDFYIDNIYALPPSTGAVEDLKSYNFSYYPSPSSSSITLNANELIKEVTIYNQLGQKVKQVSLNSLKKEINISDLEKGVYYMKVNINNTVGTISLIKN